MREVWLRNNSRAHFAVSCVALFAFAVCGWVAFLAWTAGSAIGQAVSLCLFAASAVVLLLAVAMSRQHRLVLDTPYVLAYLRGMQPIRIPIDIVECFLLGQGPALLPGEKHAKTETATLVVKLSDRAEEWSHVEVDPRLASWCDGYITIRGTWTEPLNVAVVNRLNVRLAEIAKSLPAQAAR